MTPLHVAAGKARIRIVDYLIDQKADVNFQDLNKVNIPYTEYLSQGKILQNHTLFRGYIFVVSNVFKSLSSTK